LIELRPQVEQYQASLGKEGSNTLAPLSQSGGFRIGLRTRSSIHTNTLDPIQWKEGSFRYYYSTAQVRKGYVKELTHYQGKDQRHCLLVRKEIVQLGE
jgi:hypothetical protein